MSEYSDSDLRKDVLGAAISKELGYNEGQWESPGNTLTEEDYKNIGFSCPGTVRARFGSEDSQNGWNSLKEELGLGLNFRVWSYTEKEYIENLKEESVNGKVPKKVKINQPNGLSYQSVEGNLFNSYLDAVWLSGKEPQSSWFNTNKNNKEEYKQLQRNFFIENYWHQDPKIENKPYETRIETSSNYIIPTQDEIIEKTELLSKQLLRDELFPNLRQSDGIHSISRFEQDEFMEIIESYDGAEKTGFEAWEDLLQHAKEEGDFTESQVQTMLDPNAESRDGGSFGRWMSQENMPRGAITFTSGSDERQNYEVSSQ